MLKLVSLSTCATIQSVKPCVFPERKRPFKPTTVSMVILASDEYEGSWCDSVKRLILVPTHREHCVTSKQNPRFDQTYSWPEITDIINILIRCKFAYHVEFG